MTAVESAVSFLVEKIRDSLVEDIILLRGVEEQIEWVEKEFRRVECFLKDADGKIEVNERVKNWRQELRDVAHYAEDALDIFFLRIDYVRRAEGCWGWFKRAVFIFNELSACHQVASRVQRMKLELSSISESRATYGIEFSSSSASGAPVFEYRRLSTPHHGSGEEDDDLVGFDKELPDFIGQLTSNEPRRCVFSLVGMGGVGKTTLAASLYNNNTVKGHFTVRAWVSVSLQYDVKDICSSVYKQLFKIKPQEQDDEEQLREKIKGLLKERRYLVVLDDVWKKKAWNDLVGLFPPESKYSRVLLTTRDEAVALHADELSKPVGVRLLTEDEGWKLLSKKALAGWKKKVEGREIVKESLEQKGREIVRKCDRLPLAIVAIGGALAGKDEKEWEHVTNIISWQLGEGEAAISGILNMSYRDLPYELKPCFLYLAIFPEDHVFSAKKLIRMWAAEGLLQQRGDETVEEVGEDYLKALAQRSLILRVQSSSSGGIKSCRVHDRLRDLAASEAKGDKFLQVHNRPGMVNSSPSLSIKARRLAIHHSSIEEYSTLRSSAADLLRSVFIYPQKIEKLGKEQQKSLYRRFQLLRVLDLHKVETGELPSEIGHLIHLRYLGWTDTHLDKLPPSVANLRSLQTLACQSSLPMVIPSAIEKMQHLRHFQVKSGLMFCSGCNSFEGQPRLELINNLRTLTNLTVDKWGDDSLGKLSNLQKLGLTFDPDTVSMSDAKPDFRRYCESIAKLESLQSLLLSTPAAAFGPDSDHPKTDIKLPAELHLFTHLLNLRKLSLYGQLEKLPEPAEFPVNLKKLTLAYSGLGQEALATLSKLQNLCVLKLLRRSYMEKEMTCPRDGFPRLESLHLEGLPDLEKLRIEEEAMRKLVRLNINLCMKLKMPPEGREVKDLRVEVSNTTVEEFNIRLADEASKILRWIRPRLVDQ